MNTDTMMTLFRRLINIMRHKAKALEMREEHICQRHEDGSYTLTVRMIPSGAASNLGGVDGIITHKSRGFAGHQP